ncbi:MAG: hypothetical protein HeimC2_01370 [Candidatus Heimdallarchaeota archaeon LC_2]|nr:MAG: hypothetical protein HeimC2_01370 [Candidatus Heimdallarchaeota archaeon LC_2]
MQIKSKPIMILTLIAFTLMFNAISNTSAHTAPPCNDTNDDGSSSGHEYAKHHISALAKSGGLGNDGHKPGAHNGFSVCNPSDK